MEVEAGVTAGPGAGAEKHLPQVVWQYPSGAAAVGVTI